MKSRENYRESVANTFQKMSYNDSQIKARPVLFDGQWKRVLLQLFNGYYIYFKTYFKKELLFLSYFILPSLITSFIYSCNSETKMEDICLLPRIFRSSSRLQLIKKKKILLFIFGFVRVDCFNETKLTNYIYDWHT